MKTLEALRRERGWTRSELAFRARVDPSRLGKIETGRYLPYAPDLRRLARALSWPARDGAGLLEEVVLERTDCSLADPVGGPSVRAETSSTETEPPTAATTGWAANEE